MLIQRFLERSFDLKTWRARKDRLVKTRSGFEYYQESRRIN